MSEGWELVAATMIGVVFGVIITLFVIYNTTEDDD